MNPLLVQENPVDKIEYERLEALHRLAILDTPAEERFDFLVRLAARVFGVPVAGVFLVDSDRVWSKASVGMSVASSREASFCDATIRQRGQLIVDDASVDARFADHPAVVGVPHVRFIAGRPLLAPGGEPVGALCLADFRPRALSEADQDLLGELGRWVEKELASREELTEAARMQQQLFPRTAPVLPGYRVAGRCLPARHVGGDFYDWYPVGDQYQFVLGDVMGHGIPAAMIATSVRAMLRGASRYNTVGNTVSRVAEDLEHDFEATSSFATLFCARLDPATGRVDYVDAGHGLNIVLRRPGGARPLASTDLPLGVVSGGTWTPRTTILDPGDTLASISDGWMDLFSSDQEAADTGRAIYLASTSAEDHVDRVIEYARAHDAADDITVVLITRDPTASEQHGTVGA